MNRRSLKRPVGPVVAVCALSAPMVLPPAAGGDVVGQQLGDLQGTVSETVSRAPALPALPAVPATSGASRAASTPAPSPAPAAHRASPSPSTAAPAPLQTARRVGGVQASSNQGGDVSGPALEESSSATPAGTSGGTADPTDAPDATTRPVTVEAADLEDAGAEALPFTGWTPLPMMLLAVLAVIAGVRLRRAARNVA